MMEKNIDILKEIMISVLDLDDNIEFSNLKQKNLAKWDSMAIVNLVVAVESDLGVKIKNEEFKRFYFISKYRIDTLNQKKRIVSSEIMIEQPMTFIESKNALNSATYKSSRSLRNLTSGSISSLEHFLLGASAKIGIKLNIEIIEFGTIHQTLAKKKRMTKMK